MVKDKSITKKQEVVCNRCGACCKTLHIRMPLADNVNQRALLSNMMLYWNLHEGVLTELRRDDDNKTVIMLTIQSPCSMLKEHADGTCTCKIYPMRPPICRQWPTKTNEFRNPDIPKCSMLLDPISGKHEDKPKIREALIERLNGKDAKE